MRYPSAKACGKVDTGHLMESLSSRMHVEFLNRQLWRPDWILASAISSSTSKMFHRRQPDAPRVASLSSVSGFVSLPYFCADAAPVTDLHPLLPCPLPARCHIRLATATPVGDAADVGPLAHGLLEVLGVLVAQVDLSRLANPGGTQCTDSSS